MTAYWHTGAHECSAEEFVAFVKWASTQAKLERDVKLFMEPPFANTKQKPRGTGARSAG